LPARRGRRRISVASFCPAGLENTADHDTAIKVDFHLCFMRLIQLKSPPFSIDEARAEL
jgi:hypothetical protein